MDAKKTCALLRFPLAVAIGAGGLHATVLRGDTISWFGCGVTVCFCVLLVREFFPPVLKEFASAYVVMGLTAAVVPLSLSAGATAAAMIGASFVLLAATIIDIAVPGAREIHRRGIFSPVLPAPDNL